MPEQQPSTRLAETPKPACWRIRALALFGLAASLTTLQMFVPLGGSSGWPDAVLLTFAVVATIAAFAGQIPAPNVILAGGIAAGIGGIAHAVNNVTGLPFGRFEFKPEFGPRLVGVLPVAMPLIWAIAALNARGAARRLLFALRAHPRHGYHVIGLATLMTALLLAALDPFASHLKGWWTANPISLLNVASWTVLSLLIQIAMTPLLLDKFPIPRRPVRWPLGIWLILCGLICLGLLSTTCGLSP